MKPSDELVTFENELNESFAELTNAKLILENLSNLVVQKARAAVDAANLTESYDDKLENLVKGIQDVVKSVNDVKQDVDAANQKHDSDLELLSRLRTKFLRSEKIEKMQSADKKTVE